MTDDTGKKTILVIEDNDLNLKLVRDLIKLNHTSAIVAQDAESGLELARRHKPDLILMDIELPGINGLAATEMIRKDSTAWAMPEDEQRALEAGCNGFIAKPINIKSFQKTINSYLQSTSSLQECIENHRSQRILIVDDEALNLKLLAAKLSSKGYRIATAGDGKTALEITKTEPPDLILLDIMMPGMDGYEVTARLKADPETSNIPIILVTALTGEDEKKKGLAAGADEFINKPLNYAELEARVVSLLRLKEYQEQLGTRQKSESLMINGIADIIDDTEENQGLPSILVVEDDSTSAKLITQYLSIMPCHVERAKTGKDALKIAASKKIDIMLLDLMLPCINGFEVCRAIKDNEETFPIQVVMITSLTDTRSRLKGIEVGADDFLVKPVNKDEFRARIKSLIRKKLYLDKLRAKVDLALHAAITDKLTGVYNHGYFKHFLDLELKRSRRHKHNLALLMIDVDDFKAFNDKFGHPCGDQTLRMIARILRENVRDIDLVARYGGEEFAVTLPYAGEDAARSIAGRLLRSVAGHREIESAPGARLSVSIGVALFTDFADTPEDLIKHADLALYTAKGRGKNQYCLGSDCSSRSN